MKTQGSRCVAESQFCVKDKAREFRAAECIEKHEQRRNLPQRSIWPKMALGVMAIAQALAITPLAAASTSGPAMPWDTPLSTILGSLTGTVAHILVTAAIVFSGFFFAFTEGGTGARRIFGVALGGALALGAVSFMTSVGWSGAVV